MSGCRMTPTPSWWTCGPVWSETTSGIQISRRSGKRAIFREWKRLPDGATNGRSVEQLREAGVCLCVPICFLCRSGVRSGSAAKAATAAGLGPAKSVSDGFEGQLGQDGHRTVTGRRPPDSPGGRAERSGEREG